LLVLGGPASAQDATAPDFISEIRLGVLAHDAHPGWMPWNVTEFKVDQIEDVGFDVLFRSPDLDAFRWIGSPRPNLGGTISLDGEESMAHLALTWQNHIMDTPFYWEASLGAAIHDGILDGVLGGPGTQGGKLRPQGCRVQIYTEGGIGVDLTDTVTATLTYEHMSNWSMCAPNYGLSNLGIKIGAKFN
jgi:hypothetical protein